MLFVLGIPPSITVYDP